MLSIISGCTALGCTRAGPPLGIGVFYFFFGVGYFFGRLKGSIKKTADLRRVCLSVAVLGVRPPFQNTTSQQWRSLHQHGEWGWGGRNSVYQAKE